MLRQITSLRLVSLFLAVLAIAVGCSLAGEPGEETVPTIVAEVLTAVATNNPPVATPTTSPPTSEPPFTPTIAPSPIAEAVLSTAPPAATSVPTSPTSPPPTIAPNSDLAILPNRVYFYPVPALYEGDLLTVQFGVRLPGILSPNSVESEIWIDGVLAAKGTGLSSQIFGGDVLALYPWIWDSAGRVGPHTLEIILDPDDRIQVGDESVENNRFVTTLTVSPRTRLKTVEQNARWLVRDGNYARLHVISGTAASRDLDQLVLLVDEAILTASERLNEPIQRKIDIYFIDRVIGQGGYAADSIVISYLDRNYSGGNLRELLVHETAHILDRQFGPRSRLPFMAEGLAVWAAGGHYKPENLPERARALRDSGLYIPLVELINDFYPIQHEIGYLEAGAFFDFLVNEYGWERVKAFYQDVQLQGFNSHAEAVDAHLQTHFGRGLAQLESDWSGRLDRLPYDRDSLVDVNATIRFYEVMRRYQVQFDPTAYFRQAWLPDPLELETRGLVGDLNRHPTADINITLETMLTEAENALRTGNYRQAEALMASANRVVESGSFNDPLAQAYLEIVQRSTEWGFEVHRLRLDGQQATAYVTNPYSPRLLEVGFALENTGWTLLR